MALYRVKPTRMDETVARAVARHTAPVPEQASEVLSWGADEHVLLALAAGFWLYARRGDERARTASNHILLTTAMVALLPHALKSIFDQERPDRTTLRGHLHGIGAGLVLTRVVLLAHWLSDVLAGLAMGAAVERLLRFWTGYGSRDLAG